MIRWITDLLGTSPWTDEVSDCGACVVDVRELHDGPGNSSLSLRAKVDAVVSCLMRGERVVVCCDYGISRSNAIAAAALAKFTRGTFRSALDRVVQSTGECRMKVDFVAEVRQVFDEGNEAAPQDRGFVLGAAGSIGQAMLREFDPGAVQSQVENELELLANPVLLDAAVVDAQARHILLCWHPERMDTNHAIGQLICGLRNVIEVCRIRGLGLVFISGHQVFAGLTGNGPVWCAEDRIPAPQGAIGDGLFLAESLIKQYQTGRRVSTLIVRPSHLYGRNDNRPSFFRTFVSKALANEEIVARRYENGRPLVDVLHVRDLARAIRLAVEARITGILHVASGSAIATDELAREIVRIVGSTSAVSTIDMTGECSRAMLATSRARTVLGWHPMLSLEDGVSELLAASTNTYPTETR